MIHVLHIPVFETGWDFAALFGSIYLNASHKLHNSECYCLIFRGGQRFKAEGCQSTGAKHPWYSGAPGNKFVLASVV